jgi:hypothetical protein
MYIFIRSAATVRKAIKLLQAYLEMLRLDLGDIRYYFVTRISKHTDYQEWAHFVSVSN